MLRRSIEIVIHLIFWIFILLSINVEWTASWFDQSIRPVTPAPLSVIAFGLFFYSHTFLLLPRYFNKNHWKKYLIYLFLLFTLPEIVRLLLYNLYIPSSSLHAAVFNRDGFIFGSPSPFFWAFYPSIIYYFVKDKIFSKVESVGTVSDARRSIPYEDKIILNKDEVEELKEKLTSQLKDKEIYLNKDLTLRDVASSISTTEKKVSYLINQHLKTSFYELVNSYRVEKFKEEIAKPENKQLSILGVAFNCGFPSKSSFYRSFKAQVSVSPSEYIKTISSRK